MNVLHFIGGSINSGASKAALLLSDRLNKKKIQSKIYNKNSEYFLFLERITKNIHFNKMNTTLSVGNVGFNFINTREYKEADIVHLHWINKSLIKIDDILKIDKPIVWTIRDMWPFTGVCHYSFDCKKFTSKCKQCPQLRSKLKYDLSTYVFNKKKKIYNLKKIIFVAMSDWSFNLAKKSTLLNNQKIYKFYNTFDDKNFKLINKIKAKKKLRLKTSEKIVVFGANNLHAKYKGIDYFLNALEHLDQKVTVLLVGNFWKNFEINNKKINLIKFGFVKDLTKLNYIYAAGNVYVASSLQDNSPKMPIESMLSGTPCVYFKNTTIDEMNIHNKTGYGAKYRNSRDLAKGIKRIINSKKKMSINVRKHVLKKFNQEKLIKKYIKLYHLLLKQKNSKFIEKLR